MSLAPCPCGKVPGRIVVVRRPGFGPPHDWELHPTCCHKWVRIHRSSITGWPANWQIKRWWNAAPRAEGEE